MIRFPFISLNPYCCHRILLIGFFFKRNIKVLKQKKIAFKDITQHPNNDFIIINMGSQIAVGQCLQPIFAIHDISTLKGLTNRFTRGTYFKTFLREIILQCFPCQFKSILIGLNESGLQQSSSGADFTTSTARDRRLNAFS